MPPVLLRETNGVIMDDFLLSVQAFVTKNVCKYHKHMHACVVSHRMGSLFFQLLYVALHNSPSAHVGMVVVSM